MDKLRVSNSNVSSGLNAPALLHPMNDTSPAARCSCCHALLSHDGHCPRCELTAALNCTASLPASPVSTSEAPVSPRQFGDYELLEELGHGGMGVVYRARHAKLDRTVALKLLLLGQFSSDAAVKRFQREARAAAALRHPGIVGIHDIGEVEGQPYFTMELVEGQSLASLLQAGPLPPSLAATYLRAIAQAIQSAHTASIVHRDLKPSNILIDVFGQPRITDFGLAKRFGGSGDITLTGHVLGSPNYLAPELAAGLEKQAGSASDLFSLGAILYECLTGRPPFLAPTLQATLLHIRDAEPVAPRLLNPGLPRDLETICLKCLEKEPSRRYATAKELADELGRFLGNEPIHARPIPRPERAWRWCCRKPALATTIVLGVVLILVLGIGGPLTAFRINQSLAEAVTERQHAEDERTRAVTESIRAHQMAYAAEMHLAYQSLLENNLGRASELIGKYRVSSEAGRSQPLSRTNPLAARTTSQASPLPDPRGWEWHYLSARAQGDELRTAATHSNTVTAVAFSPDGQWLVSAANDGVTHVWNRATHEIERTLSHRGESMLWAAAFSPDGKVLATAASHESPVRLWRVPEFEEFRTLRLAATNTHRHHGLVFSPDGQWLASGGGFGVRLWDLTTDKETAHFPGNLDLILPAALAFSPDSRLLAFGIEQGTMAVADLQLRRIVRKVVMHPDHQLAGLAFTPDGSRMFSGSWDGVRCWETTKFTQLAHYTNHVQFPLALSPDGRTLAVAGWDDRRIHLLDVATGATRTSLRGHWNTLHALAWSPDGRTLASGGRDFRVKLWNADAEASPAIERKYPLRLDESTVPDQRLSLSADGLWLTTAYTNQTFSVWHTATLTEAARLRSPFDYLESLAIAPGGRWLALGGGDGVLRLAEWKPYREQVSTNFGDGPIKNLLFSPDGTRLVTQTWTNDLIRVWSVPEMELIATVPSRGYLVCMNFSADGAKLALGWWSGEASIFDLETRRMQALMRGHLQQVRDVALNRDATRLASASIDGTVRLWDAGTGQEVRSFNGLFAPFGSVAFSPDENRLFAATGSGVLHVWNLATGQEVLAAKEHKTPPKLLRFLPDHTTLVSASYEEFRLWRASPRIPNSP